MKKFLIQVLLFGAIPIVGMAILLGILDREFIPAPMVTNSYSLNEKVFHVPAQAVFYLAIGSSITLNNFNSEAVTSGLGSADYVNMAAWGMRMDDIFSLARAYFKEHKPRVVFMASNVDDFYISKIRFNEEDVVGVMNNEYALWTYSKHMNPPYYFKRYQDNKVNKVRNNTYESIKFDAYGGVPLSDEGFEVNSQRWNQQPRFDQVDEHNYDYLDSLSQLLRDQKATLVFLQSPLREGLHQDDEGITKLSNHKRRVAAILKKYGFPFIDGTDRKWPDSLFVDYGHFHEEGAKAFTAYCLEKWQDEKVSYFDR